MTNLRCYLVLFFLVASAPLSAQPPEAVPATEAKPTPAAPPADTDRLTLEEAQKQVMALQAVEGQPAIKEKVLPVWLQIQSNLQEEAALQKDVERYGVDPTAVAQKTEQLKKELNEKPEPPQAVAEKYSTSAELREALTQTKQEIVKVEGELKDLDLRLKTRDERRKVIPEEISQTEKQLADLKNAPPYKPAEGDPAELIPAAQQLQNSEQQKLGTKLQKLNLERQFYEINTELRTLQKQQNQRKLSDLQRLADALQKRLTLLENQEATEAKKAASRLVQNVSEPLKPLARSIEDLAERRNAPDSPFKKSQELEKRLKHITLLLDQLQKERDETEERIENSAREATLGPYIDEQRAQLPSVYDYEQLELQHSRQVSAARRAESLLEKELQDLSDLNDELTEILGREVLAAEEDTELEVEARKLLDVTKRNLLNELLADYDNYRTLLNDLSSKENEIVNFIQSYNKYLNEKSMWVRISDVFRLNDIPTAIRALPVCFQKEDWQNLLLTLRDEAVEHPIIFGLIAMGFISFLGVHTRFKRRLNELNHEVSSGYLAPFALTRQAFLITLVIALWVPSLLGFVGYRLNQLATGSAFIPAVGTALMGTAFVIGLLRMTRYLARVGSLGVVHFRWPKEQLSRVRIHLHWYTLAVVPLVFIGILVQSLGDTGQRDTLGRLILSSILILTAIFLYRVLAPPKLKDERTSVKKMSFGEKLSLYGPTFIPLFFALLSLIGYTYTAQVLCQRLGLSCAVLLLLVMINEMGYRWLYIARGKLALEQAKKRQEARQAELAREAENQGETTEAPKPFDPKAAGVDLSQVNTQTRQLLGTAFRLSVLFALWIIWRGVTPPIGVLDYPLWASDEIAQIARQTAGETSGEESAEPIVSQVKQWVTIGDLILVGLVIVITIIASKNLPGLLEITVLQNLPLDTGIRYAAGMMARYLLIAIGIVIATGLLGVGVTQVSFLLGGLAVGLGFGLQELFANFVSGIILLFEQPLRIGDLVTLGDVTGNVTKIRIRATTITDWDRKEYIVPNKEFITGMFRNWTLTDSINRLVFKVGIAYGNDTERAKRILLQVANRHPRVLEDPPASAVFDEFGASSLNLTLRCFLSSIEYRLEAIHDIHSAIDREFKKAGLEIAFHQMDLHLRSIDDDVSPLPLEQTIQRPK